MDCKLFETRRILFQLMILNHCYKELRIEFTLWRDRGYTHLSLYIFQLKFADDEETYQVNSDDLFNIGFTIKFENSGLVLVANRYTKQQFYCVFDPHFKRQHVEDNSPQQNDYFESDNEPKSNTVQNSTFSIITG